MSERYDYELTKVVTNPNSERPGAYIELTIITEELTDLVK